MRQLTVSLGRDARDDRARACVRFVRFVARIGTGRGAQLARLGSRGQDSRHTAMILTQVHLRKPCYDFYFLEVIKFVSLSARDATPKRRVPRAVRGPH